MPRSQHPLSDKLVDGVRAEQRAELLEGLLAGLAHAQIHIVEVQQERHHVGMDLTAGRGNNNV